MARSKEEETVRACSELVYRLAYAQTRSRADADDIYQEVFLRYLRRRPDFQSEEHRRAWFIRVSVNCCKRLWASPWRRLTVPLEGVEIPFEREESSNLDRQLRALPEKYRTVVHLFYYEELSVEEIGRVLGRKPSTVRTQLTRARERLRAILKEDNDV